MITIHSVPAIVIFSDHPERLATWYQEVFSLQNFLRTNDFVGFATKNLSLFIQRSAEGQKPGVGGVRPHFCVDNVEKAYEELLKKGALSRLAPQEIDNEWIAAVDDPEGNPLGLLSYKDPSILTKRLGDNRSASKSLAMLKKLKKLGYEKLSNARRRR